MFAEEVRVEMNEDFREKSFYDDDRGAAADQSLCVFRQRSRGKLGGLIQLLLNSLHSNIKQPMILSETV